MYYYIYFRPGACILAEVKGWFLCIIIFISDLVLVYWLRGRAGFYALLYLFQTWCLYTG